MIGASEVRKQGEAQASRSNAICSAFPSQEPPGEPPRSRNIALDRAGDQRE